MPRDPNGIIQEVWASADASDRATPADRGFTIPEGWPDRFSAANGPPPTREMFNWLFFTLFSFAVEVNRSGLLAWDASVAYAHPAVVSGSDGHIYDSVQDSTNVDPVTDADNSHWRRLIRVENASTSTRGIVELATDSEAAAGANSDKAVTPSGLAQRTPNATTSVRGLVEMATSDEARAGTDTSRAVTPRGLAARTPDASATTKGLVELATDAEVETGTDASRAVTPASLEHADVDSVDGYHQVVLTQAQYDALAVKDPNTFYDTT